MIAAGKEDILHHFSEADFDSTATLILEKVSTKFLDKALELRLRTIEAKPLINALARAERLGYEANDVVEVEDEEDRQERVIPQAPGPVDGFAMPVSGLASAPFFGTPSVVQESQPNPFRPLPPTPLGPLQCEECLRVFKAASAHKHVGSPAPESLALC